MYTKSRNIEIVMGNKTDDIVEELPKSLLQNYTKNLKEPMRGSKFLPDSTDLLPPSKNRFEKRQIKYRFF